MTTDQATRAGGLMTTTKPTTTHPGTLPGC